MDFYEVWSPTADANKTASMEYGRWVERKDKLDNQDTLDQWGTLYQ